MKFSQTFSKSMMIIASGLMTLPVFAADPPVPGSEAPVSASASASKTPKVKCREEKVTGSSFRTRKVCTSTDSQNGSGDWVREQQQRGSIGASAILNGGGG